MSAYLNIVTSVCLHFQNIHFKGFVRIADNSVSTSHGRICYVIPECNSVMSSQYTHTHTHTASFSWVCAIYSYCCLSPGHTTKMKIYLGQVSQTTFLLSTVQLTTKPSGLYQKRGLLL